VKRYTTVDPLYLSFFSRPLYRDVAVNWRGLGFVYLVSLLALCIIPGVLKVRADISAFLDEEAPKIISQMPSIHIVKGSVSVDAQQPYIIRDEKTGDPFIIIDTTGKVTSLKDSKAAVLLTKRALMVKSDGDSRTLGLEGIENLTVDRKTVYSAIDDMDAWFLIVVYPLTLLFSFLYHAVQALLFASLGLLVSRNLRLSLHYRSLVRLSAVALTPAMIIGAASVVTGLYVPGWWLMSILVSLGYLFFAITASSERSEEEGHI